MYAICPISRENTAHPIDYTRMGQNSSWNPHSYFRLEYKLSLYLMGRKVFFPTTYEGREPMGSPYIVVAALSLYQSF